MKQHLKVYHRASPEEITDKVLQELKWPDKPYIHGNTTL